MRFVGSDGATRVGLRAPDSGDLRSLPGVTGVAQLLRLTRDDLRLRLEEAARATPDHQIDDVTVLPPIDGDTEVWASGVTYERSRQARGEESDSADLYDRVYDADRPELFFKSVPWRVVTDGEPIGVRDDSGFDVPEPELALVVNAHAEIVGYTVCDDVSSRSIEGENALYLPQAKVYAGSCALASRIVPAWEVGDVREQRVRMRIVRAGADAFTGEIPLTALRRNLEGLVSWLFRSYPFPDGAVLATGTGIVPGMDFTLRDGDVVEIEISGVGTLSNPVAKGTDPFAWLLAARDAPRARSTTSR
ncbi:fumarylacetoacetate hydrolase family protein [Spiractinospora alimapuensis]|nr:fumarylacetoacetate hydrolase family protein [Spiractinospora alimapuensis]